MPTLQPVRQMDLTLHGRASSISRSLLQNSIITDDQVAGNAGIQQSKIAGLVAALAALGADIAAESSRATAEEGLLDGRLDLLEGSDSVVGSVANAVKLEENRAVAAEQALGVEIAEEVSRALLAEEALSDAIAAEEARAVAAEGVIAADLAQEVLDRQQAVSDEEARALAAEGVIAANLAQEILDRVADVEAEELRATTAESALQGLIDSETQRATAAEGEIAGDLAEEIARALAAEADLSSLKYDKAGGEIDGNVDITGTLEVAGTSTFTGDVTAAGNLTVQGDLVINGNMTSVNSVDMVVNDRLVHLNEPATAGANDPVPTSLAGISIHRGSDAGVEREHAGMVWDEDAQKFVLQFLAEDGAGSAKLSFEAKNIKGETLELVAQNGTANSYIETSAYDLDMTFINGDNQTNFEVEDDGVILDAWDLTNGLYAQFQKNAFHIERTADNYATNSQFDINPDGVQLRDGNNDPLMPLNDEHLVVKKYVDDEIDAAQTSLSSDLATEVTNRTNADLGLAADIAAEVLRATTAEGVISANLAQEILDRQADVDAEETRAIAAEGVISANLAQEVLDRVADVEAEELRATTAEGVLQTNITAEETRAMAEELDIRNDFTAADLVLDGKITAEETRAMAEEADIRSDFAAADALLQTAIDNEVLRAQNEEADIRADFAADDATTLSSAQAYTELKIAELVDSAPGVLDTLKELALALGNDENFSTTVLTAIANEQTRAEAAEAALEASVGELYDKSGIVAGVQNTYSTTNVVANGDSLVAAIGKIDDALADVAGKSYHEAFIFEATGVETSLAKPAGAPAIPDSAFTEVYIDGRKVFRGEDRQFTVAVDGGSINFATLTAGQTVELRYFA